MEPPTLLVLHAPPVAMSVNVIEAPTQTLSTPVMSGTTGKESIIITENAMSLPQLFVTVYLIVSEPADIPVTTPPATVAIPDDVLQTPPDEVSAKVIDKPTHMFDAPLIATGNGFTVTVVVTWQPVASE